MKCSCCINTYARPELLKKLLISLHEQKLPVEVELEIIVVDNGPQQKGRKVVEGINDLYPNKIKYIIQSKKNISLTRNIAVHNTTGEYIFFIDDDGYADTNWIRNMLSTIIKFNSDAVFGRVIPYFEKNTPEWLIKGGFFERECAKTGEIPRFTRTGNCLIKAKLLKSVDGPFDLRYGLTGGSDTHLFENLLKNNAKFVSCYEGIVFDYVHPERANFKWLFKRSIRTGNTFTRRRLENSSSISWKKILFLFKGIVYSTISIMLILSTCFSKKYRIFWTLKLGGNFGHILAVFNQHYEEYK